jgi:16S rRNA (guanine(966)-N(2))-methyltransferase RsmD
VRIIGGKFKGRKFNAPFLKSTRPTTDFARESLFNLLQTRFDVDGIEILDLFCGTGAVAFEFLSRGAKSAVCVDMDFKGLQFIRETSRELKVEARVYRGDALKYLSATKEKFDLIFTDPPYELEDLPKIPELVFQHHLLKPGGILIVEHGKKTDLSAHRNFEEHRHYGKVNFSFFKA